VAVATEYIPNNLLRASRIARIDHGFGAEISSRLGIFSKCGDGRLLCYDLPVSRPPLVRFITFEGLDGCGKSTQAEKLAAALRVHGYSVVVTREPGGTATGERIRQLLVDSSTSGLNPFAELALIFASRAQHINEVIRPALSSGQIVICDRFTDSTEAYQGGGRKLGRETVLLLHHTLCGSLQPDLTILMESDAEESVNRARKRNRSALKGDDGRDENRFEQESRVFFGRVRKSYMEIAAREPSRVVKVNARGTPTQTHRQIMELVVQRMQLAQESRSASAEAS
jgi:dTMP kinase